MSSPTGDAAPDISLLRLERCRLDFRVRSRLLPPLASVLGIVSSLGRWATWAAGTGWLVVLDMRGGI